MSRIFLLIPVFVAALVARAADQPLLQVYIVSQEARPELRAADFPALPKLGYIAKKPDLTISQLEDVSFGVRPPPADVPDADAQRGEPKEDPSVLVLRLTAKDAEALKQLTSAHLGARMLMLLNDEPLFAPLLRTPSSGQSVYITPPPRSDTEKLKARLQTLVKKPG